MNCLSRFFPRPMIVPAVLLLVLCSDVSAWGQLFGERTLGQPLQRRGGTAPAAEAEADVGTLEGNERFLRENRSRSEFVGSDRRSLGGFVGSAQALGSGRVPAATESLQETSERGGRLNQPVPRLPEDGMYYPRLVLGNSFRKAPAKVSSPTSGRAATLQSRLAQHAERPIHVELEGPRAILRGTVASAEQARLLKLIVSFEPAIDTIEDQLTIDKGDDPAERPGALPRP